MLFYRHGLPEVLAEMRLHDARCDGCTDFRALPEAAGSSEHKGLVEHSARTLDPLAVRRELDASEPGKLLHVQSDCSRTH